MDERDGGFGCKYKWPKRNGLEFLTPVPKVAFPIATLSSCSKVNGKWYHPNFHSLRGVNEAYPLEKYEYQKEYGKRTCFGNPRGNCSSGH